MKKLIVLFILAACMHTSHAGVVSGVLEGPSGLPIKNGTLAFKLLQAGLIEGSGSVVPLSVNCYTSTDGSVVGLPNPLGQVVSSINYGSGTLPGGIYYVETTFYSGSQETLPSPELRIQLTGAGTLNINPSASFPPNAAGMRVYIGQASGVETLQGQTASPTAQYSQSIPLIAGASVPSTNSSLCSIAFNDTIIPYSGYNVSLSSSSGNSYPGWPQAWQLNGGFNGTVNISNGAPLWNGTVIYPQPIVAQPLNHGPQSISGSLNLSGYNLAGAGAVGIGTNTPSWTLDVENGANGLINASGGYLYNGGAGIAGQCLVSNGTAFAPAPCFAPSSLFYQTVESGTASQPQEPALNFSSSFTTADTPGARTTVGMASSGVSAGSYTNAAITVNAAGQVTAAASGPAVPVIQSVIVNSAICTTGNSAYASCGTTITWPEPFVDANYAVSCTPQQPTAIALTGTWVANKTASNFEYFIENGSANGTNNLSLSEIDCIGVHP